MKALGRLLSTITWGIVLFTPILISLIPQIPLLYFHANEADNILVNGILNMDIPSLFSIFGGSTSYSLSYQAHAQPGDYISYITFTFDGVLTHFNIGMYFSYFCLTIAFLIVLLFYKSRVGSIAILCLVLTSHILTFFAPTFFKISNPNFFSNISLVSEALKIADLRYGVGIYATWGFNLLAILLASFRTYFNFKYQDNFLIKMK